MTVLIANTSEEVVRKYYPTLKLTPKGQNTSTFRISQAKFKEIREQMWIDGYNTYAIFFW